MRYSRQREAVREFVSKSHGHPTAQDVYQAVREELPNVSLGTVYRNLMQLSEIGELRLVDVGDGITRFDAHVSRHQHFRCLHCGRIFDVDSPKVDEVRGLVGKDLPGRVDYLSLTLNGVCSSCLERELNKGDHNRSQRKEETSC